MKRQHKVFADEIVKGTQPTIAYKIAYPKAKDATARAQAYRIIQIHTVAGYIKQESEKIRSAATQQAVDELKEEIKVDMLEVTQKRNLLFKIATAQHEVDEILGYKEVAGEDGKTSFQIIRAKRKPTPYEIAKAIELDNKMAGDFAPTKVAQTDTKGNDVPILNFVPASALKPEEIEAINSNEGN